MFRILLKKQLREVYRSWFYNSKTNKARSVGSTISVIVLFSVLMVGSIGGMFTYLALSLCEGLHAAGMDWMYFTIVGLLAVALGLFGSVFNCYSSLYLAKDNDLLLSMPIPVDTIIASRLFNVYLMGAMYSALVFIPAMAVYQIKLGFNTAVLFGSIIMLLEITLLILVLSCLLGWVVAKISLKLKGRSFVTVLVSLTFIVLYYVVYFKAQELIQNLVQNAAEYGEKIKGSAYFLYLWGKNGTGNYKAIFVYLAVCAAAAAASWVVLSKSFLRIATSTAKEKKSTNTISESKARSLTDALLRKELARFTSSANYMLNCGFGVLFIPAGGILLLVKGSGMLDAIAESTPGLVKAIPVMVVGFAFLLASMNDMAAPSISLEGKSLWLLQSLPVSPWQAIRAKIQMQLILTEIPMFVFCICILIVLSKTGMFSVSDLLLSTVMCLLCPVLSSLFAMFMGLKMPNLEWTNEIVPIKQSGGVVISVFGGWGFAAVMVLGYFGFQMIPIDIGAALYLVIVAVISLILSLLLLRWLKNQGGKVLMSL